MRFSGKYISNRIYSIAMLDMDGLKKINDEYGHLAGNNAICILADSIKTAISDEDLVIRYGGDEFLILSLTTDKDYWPAIGKKVNNIMQTIPFRSHRVSTWQMLPCIPTNRAEKKQETGDKTPVSLSTVF